MSNVNRNQAFFATNTYPSPPPPFVGGHSHAWCWWATSPGLTPFWRSSRSRCVPFDDQHQLIDLLLCAEKIGLSLSHFVPEIIWPKFVLLHFSPKSVSWAFWSILYKSFNLVFGLVDPVFVHLWKRLHFWTAI